MQGEFIWPVRVYYEDTDAGGVVYHANFLRYLERARSEWLRGHGFEQDELRERDGVLFTVSRAELEFLKPARFNDELRVSVRIARYGRVTLNFAQEVTRGKGEVVCRASVRIACVDSHSLRPCAIPERILRGVRVDH